MYKIFTINPGPISAKVGLFHNTELYNSKVIRHSKYRLNNFER